jgi:hypothetical protein
VQLLAQRMRAGIGRAEKVLGNFCRRGYAALSFAPGQRYSVWAEWMLVNSSFTVRRRLIYRGTIGGTGGSSPSQPGVYP